LERPGFAQRPPVGTHKRKIVSSRRLQSPRIELPELAGGVGAFAANGNTGANAQQRRVNQCFAERCLDQRALVVDRWKKVGYAARVPLLFCDCPISHSQDRHASRPQHRRGARGRQTFEKISPRSHFYLP
jgi:hypothetical protein